MYLNGTTSISGAITTATNVVNGDYAAGLFGYLNADRAATINIDLNNNSVGTEAVTSDRAYIAGIIGYVRVNSGNVNLSNMTVSRNVTSQNSYAEVQLEERVLMEQVF